MCWEHTELCLRCETPAFSDDLLGGDFLCLSHPNSRPHLVQVAPAPSRDHPHSAVTQRCHTLLGLSSTSTQTLNMKGWEEDPHGRQLNPRSRGCQELFLLLEPARCEDWGLLFLAVTRFGDDFSPECACTSLCPASSCLCSGASSLVFSSEIHPFFSPKPGSFCFM